MRIKVNNNRKISSIDPMIYGQFIEHFHRQIYGGVYEPGHPTADEDGFRTDVIDAMRQIKVPILRWPGGCFVSAYHWKDGVGPKRTPMFDKAWRVPEPNSFGTDEYVKMCRKIGCEPYSNNRSSLQLEIFNSCSNGSIKSISGTVACFEHKGA